MERSNPQLRTLTVAEWRKLTEQGDCLPVRITLQGGSMRPLIRREKDFVTILPLTRPVKKGDIVLFADPRQPGRYVVHRVNKVTTDHVITQGDHCIRADALLRPEQIWGLVTRVERGEKVLSVDTPVARLLGRLWMFLLPLRRCYYKIRKEGNRVWNKP